VQAVIKNKLARKLSYVPMHVAERETRVHEHHSEKDICFFSIGYPIC